MKRQWEISDEQNRVKCPRCRMCDVVEVRPQVDGVERDGDDIRCVCCNHRGFLSVVGNVKKVEWNELEEQET